MKNHQRAPRAVASRHRLALFSWMTTAALLLATFGVTGQNATAQLPRAVSGAGAVLPITFCCPWGTTHSYNPYNAYFPQIGDDFVYLPLAVEIPPTLRRYSPQAASSWKASGNTLTVTLRKGLSWQNGSRVTSTDVYDTALLNGTEGVTWPDLTNITTPSSNKIVFTIRSGVPMALAEQTILQLTPYPASEFGKFVTPTLKKDEIAYFNEAATNPTAAGNMPQYKAISAVFTKLSTFSPPAMIGDGPFRMDNMTTLEAKMTTWKGFFDASKVHLSGMEVLNATSNQIMYPWLYSGKADWTLSYLPPPIVQHWLSLPHRHIDLVPQGEYIMVFNDHVYPLKLTKVRQALTYIIPRSKIIRLAYGTKDPDGAPEPHPDGLTPSLEKLYLSASERKQLNSYPVDPAKAAHLLRQAGLHKSHGKWMLANGKPFTLSLMLNSSTSDIEASFGGAVAALDAFGIKSSLDPITGTAMSEAIAKGNFQIANEGTYSLNPLIELASMLGTGNNFITLGSYSGDRGLGFGPKLNVPGLGKVDVAPTIEHESESVGPGAEMNKLTWDWAHLVNQEMPFLQYGNKVWQMSYSNASFVGWPAKSSPLWQDLGYSLGGGWLLILEHGSLKPRS